jgi:hypothetical protein
MLLNHDDIRNYLSWNEIGEKYLESPNIINTREIRKIQGISDGSDPSGMLLRAWQSFLFCVSGERRYH